MNPLMNPVGSNAEGKLNCINAVVITQENSQLMLGVFSFFRDSCHRDSRAAEGSGSYSENMRTCPPSGASRAAYRPCFSRAAKTGRSPAAAAPCMPAGRNCPARTSG